MISCHQFGLVTNLNREVEKVVRDNQVRCWREIVGWEFQVMNVWCRRGGDRGGCEGFEKCNQA